MRESGRELERGLLLLASVLVLQVIWFLKLVKTMENRIDG